MKPPIWITGANGFIGRHLAKILISNKELVIRFERSNFNKSKNNKDKYLFPHNKTGFHDAKYNYGLPHRVYHLAGGSTVGQSFSNPHKDFVSNVHTTELLLEALKGSKANLVYASSAAVYGDGHSENIKVSDPLNPRSPYGHNKIISEELIKSFVNNFDLSATILRLFSIYGPGLQKQLLFDCCKKLYKSSMNDTLVLGGTGEEIRDWVEVTDVIDAMINLDTYDLGSLKIYNLASGSPIKIQALADMLISKWGKRHKLLFNNQKRHGDPFCLKSDLESLPPQFTSKVNIEEGIVRYIDWFKSQSF